MRTLYLDCRMGAAGDMLNAALYELLDEEKKQYYIEKMNSLGLEGVSVVPEKSVKCGVVGTHMHVAIEGLEEHEHHHEHEHEHEHHLHSSPADIGHIISHCPVSEAVKANAKAVYGLIADAESHAHGRPVSEIHFHEVGTLDAVADVVGCCLLMELIAPERVIASPVHVGSGYVRCAHGILPVPAPATAFILKGVPIYGGEIPVELCTPTGAALLKHFVKEYRAMPPMRIEAVGYGMGRKDLPRLNCVRALLGEAEGGADAETVFELVCDIDDMTPERIGFAMEKLLEAGALDVTTQPVGMKKSRPGTRICVLCGSEKRDELLKLMFRHTTTWGIRERACRRYTLERNTEYVGTEFGPVRVKEAQGFGVAKAKYEYEDLARIARERELALDEVAEMIDKGLI